MPATDCSAISIPACSTFESRIAYVHEVVDLDDSVDMEDPRWAATVSVALDRLVDDFELDSLVYYHRGLNGEIHERVGAGMIVGASLFRVGCRYGSGAASRRPGRAAASPDSLRTPCLQPVLRSAKRRHPGTGK
jgi:hypothetical protein